ncbi:prepilin-type N-terminal cleavage/methylation domain-containing protein [Dyella psychrodurans]|uniref:Prepilin-type N-terminal cleavage/methylation domain-containing protein n=2 Tax=Dyella psychrodurans TaxID=1927960 RepID=A0A370XB60_9GAMM|nr:prepilin-type N-terminal cleavage/methylation domain-containing protein [Dyella psychrodurans]
MTLRPLHRHELARRVGAQAGFSLIELMVVVAIIAVLAAIAYPSYTQHVIKANRSAAEGCLSEYSNYMERYYTTNLGYNQQPASGSTAAIPFSTPALDCAATSQTGNNYQYTVPAPSATGYTAEATPIGTLQTKDTLCGTLTINQQGQRNISGTGTLAQCW